MDRQKKRVAAWMRLRALAAICLAAAMPLSLNAEKSHPPQKKKSIPSRTHQAVALTPRERVLKASPLAMYYYIGDSRGLQSMQAHGARMRLLAPQCYWISREGEVRGALPPHLAETARRMRVAIMPLVVNRGFNREDVTELLHNPVARERAANDMAFLASKEGFIGFQIDIENIAPEDGSSFTEFVRQAAERLHRDDLLLSVTLVPKFTDALPAPSTEPTMGQWAAAYDYRALGESADLLTLMAYDHFSRLTGAGPIAGYEWVRKALDYAVARIPPEKLLLGIPLYGREWVEIGDSTRSRSLDAREIAALRARWKPAAQWDERWRSPWFQYRRRKVTYTVWFENRRSWSAKLDLISEYHLRGFAAWRLGFESPSFWGLSGIRPSPASRTAQRRTLPIKPSKPAAPKENTALPAPSGPSH